MKQLLTDVKALTLIAGSAALSLGATAWLLRAEAPATQVDCLTELPELVASFAISSSGSVSVVLPGGEMEEITLCAQVDDQGRKRRKRRRHPHADRDGERVKVRVIEARERAAEAAERAREARERAQDARVRVDEVQVRIEEAMERAQEARVRIFESALEPDALGALELEEAIERALESIDDDEIAERIEVRMKRLDEQLERLEKRESGGN